MSKLILALLVAWAGWYLWVGPRRYRGGAVPPDRARPVDGGEARNESFEAAQARALLGVGPDAGADEIRAAHRRLIVEVHPDRGGSAELTRRVNAARDLLLGRP